MPNFETNPFSQPKQELKPPNNEQTAFTKTLLNKEGEKICKVVLGMQGNRVTSFLLEGEKEGKPTSIDILTLTGAANDKTLCIVPTTVDKGGSYGIREHEIRIPFPSHSVAIGVALHELGHFRQYQTKQYIELHQLEQFIYTPQGQIQFLRKINDLIPETRSKEMTHQIDYAEQQLNKAIALRTEQQQKTEKLIDPLYNQYVAKYNHVLLSHVAIGQEEASDLFKSIHEALPDKQHARASEVWNILKERGFEFEGDFSSEDFFDPDIVMKFMQCFDPQQFNPYQRHNTVAENGTKFVFSYFGKKDWVGVRVLIKDPAVLQRELDALDEEYLPNISTLEDSLYEQYDEAFHELENEVHSILERYREQYKYLPHQIRERDATFRALQWMRIIKRDTDIDLFQEVLIPLRQSSLSTLLNDKNGRHNIPWELGELFSKFCGASQPIESSDDVIITPQASLKAGLTTYGALGAQLRRVTANQHGKSPIPRILTKEDSE